MAALSPDGSRLLQPRAYQLEMLDASLERNVIIAMDTGSGKTNVAILRMSAELEKTGLDKRVWFLCPNVHLAQQQYKVIAGQLPVFQTRMIVGSDGPSCWSSQSIWDLVLHNISIVVCTYQVLLGFCRGCSDHLVESITGLTSKKLDALIHGFVPLSSISLLVFDEAHNCQAGNPANKIMQRFYHQSKVRGFQVPHILGLSASPTINSKVGGLEEVEQNLNAISRTPKIHRDGLLKFVRLPELIRVSYDDSSSEMHLSCLGIGRMYQHLSDNIMEDPSVMYSRSLKAKYRNKKIEAALAGKTYCQEQVKRLANVTFDVHNELGKWPAAFYLKQCIMKYKSRNNNVAINVNDLSYQEYKYLLKNFIKFIEVEQTSEWPGSGEISSKTNILIEILASEMKENTSAIVFVKTRASVRLLQYILTNDARTKCLVRVGTLVGTSADQNRKDHIGNLQYAVDQENTLDDLATGVKNLLITTSVCEEGIDISACNLVICFEKPPNLKSFIQRRGRARSAKSKYFILLPESQAPFHTDWEFLEERMKALYIDDMRQLEEIRIIEDQEIGHREFYSSAGARLHLDEAVRHLHHFCNTLPTNGYVATDPVFMLTEDASGNKSCQVVLPNSVDSSIRRFHSPSTWKTERLAKADAAFEAFIGLHKAGLINENLMPISAIDEEAERAYAALEKRPNVVTVSEQVDPWLQLTAGWEFSESKTYSVLLKFSTGRIVQMRFIAPPTLPSIVGLKLYIDATTTAEVHMEALSDMEACEGQVSHELAAGITQLILSSTLRARMDANRTAFCIYCIPMEAQKEPQLWLQKACGSFAVSEVGLQLGSEMDGLIHDRTIPGRPFVSHGIEQVVETDTMDIEEGVPMLRIRARALMKKKNFLVPVEGITSAKALSMKLLNPADCSVDRLPLKYALFSTFFPSIMHHITSYCIAQRLCDTAKDVAFRDPSLVLQAITASSATAGYDYQKLEFFGDSLLKFRTSLQLISSHPNWHEGVLSRAKDHIVSNSNLALTCQETGLSKFIITKSFTFRGWSMPYVDDVLEHPLSQGRVLSTKTLADVVESLIGAAYLDGGDHALQQCLAMVLPKVKWQQPEECWKRLWQLAVSSDNHALPDQYKPIETLMNYSFNNKGLVIESITHGSYPGTSNVSSYQRLEFIGDSVLDLIVTKIIRGHPSNPPVKRSHSLRSAAVNGNFLAYLAMSLTVSVEYVEFEAKASDSDPKMMPSLRQLSLPHFMRTAPIPQITTALQKTYQRFETLRKVIKMKLEQGIRYPWVELTTLGAEKVVSDLVESTLGAIAIDSGGDMAACERWLDKLGVLPWLQQALDSEVELLHPKEGLGIAAVTDSVEYKTALEGTNQEGEPQYVCCVCVGDKEIGTALGRSRIEAETRAADEALEILKSQSSASLTQLVEAKEAVSDSESGMEATEFHDAMSDVT